MKATIGASAAKCRLTVSCASSNSTTPNAAIRSPAIRTAVSGFSAIAGLISEHGAVARLRLDPELTEADVGVNDHLRCALRRAAKIRPVMVDAARLASEDGRGA